MKFTLHEPVWYSQNYELDNCLKELSRLLSDVLVGRIYGEVDKLSITPTVAPKDEYNEKIGWLGYIHYVKSIKTSFIFHPIDYQSYMCGTVEERKKLTIKCIVEAVEMFKEKKTAKFPIKRFVADILEISGYSMVELNNIAVKGTEFRVEPNKEMIRAKELEVKFQDSLSFRNDGISRTILSQYIDYVKTQSIIGNPEYVTLTDRNTKVSIHATYNISELNPTKESISFLVEVIQETEFGNGEIKIVEHLSKLETIKLFEDFFDRVVIDSTYMSAILRSRELDVNFAGEMPYKNQCIAKSYLKDYVRFIEIQTKYGNPEFVTLVDKKTDEFIQAAYILEDINNSDVLSKFSVEVRYMNDHNGGRGDYSKKYLNKEETVKAFEDFFDKKIIDLNSFDNIINNINWANLDGIAENNQSSKDNKSLFSKIKDKLSSR